jgi:hypothetical protein
MTVADKGCGGKDDGCGQRRRLWTMTATFGFDGRGGMTVAGGGGKSQGWGCFFASFTLSYFI